MPKFTQIYNQMIKDHKTEFDQFKLIHDQYRSDKASNQTLYNNQGKPILEIIREYEDRLCSGMERGVYGMYSNKVSEKFWERIKKDYPLIELVGAEISLVK